jgi:hypothetical protein
MHIFRVALAAEVVFCALPAGAADTPMLNGKFETERQSRHHSDKALINFTRTSLHDATAEPGMPRCLHADSHERYWRGGCQPRLQPLGGHR